MPENGATNPPSHRLATDAIGPWGLAALAIGITSPAMGLYGLWGPMQQAAGPITPLIFVAAMLMTLPTAISYAELNREVPSAGASATWIGAAVHPLAGVQAGLLMTTYFGMATVSAPLLFDVFLQDLLALLHISLPTSAVWTFGLFISSAPVAWVCLRGAEISTKTAVRLMTLETLVVVALSVTILGVKSKEVDGINLLPFDIHNGSSLEGFWRAMILGVLAFCGFDVVSTAAEEARAPSEYVPKAILLTILGMGLFWAFNAWVLTLSTPPKLVSLYNARSTSAVTSVAQTYWGWWGHLLVILTAFTGITAIYISSMQGTSRIVFALARQGVLAKRLGHLTGEKRVPTNAVLTIGATVLALDLGSLYVLENSVDSFIWWSNALVFFAVLTFLAVNLANALYFWRVARKRFTIVKNALAPAIGVLLNGYLMYAAFFSALWAGNWRTGKSVVVTCTTLLALQIAVVVLAQIFKRDRLYEIPSSG